jgi:hypothetical protein
MKSVWAWLDGKKTMIAASLNIVFAWICTRGWLNESDATMFAALLTIWTGVGIGDKIRKMM